MNRYCKLLSSLTLAVALGGLAAPSLAGPAECDPLGPHGRHFESSGPHQARQQQRLHDALSLTSAQEGAWTKLTEAERPPAKAAPGQAAEWARLTAPERAERRLERVKDLEARLTTQVAALKDFYAGLTPEQKKVFDAFHVAPGRAAQGRMRPPAAAAEAVTPKP